MERKITGNHFMDEDGNPSGGTTFGQGFAIGWQNGPLNRGENRIEPNGAFVEDIITAAIGRLNFYQQSRFNSSYNAEAIRRLREAVFALNQRTADRETREVEGTHAV